MSFEQETDTIKRLQIAIRNSDMELLKEASYKLHEKFHEGYKFEMLQELNQILMYVQESDIPTDIKEILCPTIEEILDKETSQNASNNQDVELYSSETTPPDEPTIHYEEKNITEEESPYIDVMPAPIPTEDEDNIKEEQFQNIINETEEEIKPVNYDKPVEIYEPTDYTEQKNQEETTIQDAIETYQNQFASSSDYVSPSYIQPEITEAYKEYREEDIQSAQNSENEQNENSYNDISSNEEFTYKEEFQEQTETEENYNQEIEKDYKEEVSDVADEIKEEEKNEKRLAIFYYDKKSSPLPTSKQIGELSDTFDMVDTDIYDFEKLLIALKGKKLPPYAVTTSQSIKLSEFLIQENIAFKIPFVPNTTVHNEDYEIVPMWGLSNMFKCEKCNSKILSYSFNNKVLSVKCSSCSGVMYPEMYSANNNINPYYWQRAFGALASSPEWILINPPQDNDIIRDFIETVYQSSKPEKIYLYPVNNYYEDFFAKHNPNCEIISYQTQEKMLLDFGYFPNTQQVSM